MTLKQDWYLIEQLLLEEEKRNIADPVALDERTRNLQRLGQLLSEIDKQHMAYRCRYERLVAHQNVEYVKWAQKLLNHPHFAILDLYRDPTDETGTRRQIVVINRLGETLFEAVFTSFGVVSGPTNDVRPTTEGLQALISTIDGRFLAVSDAGKVCVPIRVMAHHCHIDMPAVWMVETLLEEFHAYFLAQHPDYEDLFHYDESAMLAALCERIGQPLDKQTSYSAKGRVLALLQVLRAIAGGFVDSRAKAAFLMSDPASTQEHRPNGEDEGGIDGFDGSYSDFGS